MIKKIITASVISLATVSTGFAMYMPIWRGGDYYQPEDNTKSLVVYRKGVETLVLQPSWKASTKDFGLVVPVPAKPTLGEVSETIFDELETLTNNQRYVIYPMMKAVSMEAVPQAGGVTLVEQRDLGRMTVSVLTATNKEGLTTWLKQNGYDAGQYTTENVDYYIKKGGYYFVAMKVQVDTVKQMTSDQYYYGKLNPISISFSSSKPVLPTRSMYSDGKQINFTIFTLSDKPYYINGSELQFTRPLGTQDLQTAPILKEYARSGDWLTRSLVTFDPTAIKEDIILDEGSRAIKIQDIMGRRLINSHKINPSYGIVDVSLATPLFAGKNIQTGFLKNLKKGSSGSDVKLLQYVLKSKGYLGEEDITGQYDQNTTDAVKLFQEDRVDTILKPSKLTEGTGFLGTITRKALNQEFFK